MTNEFFQIDLVVNDVTHSDFLVKKVEKNLYSLEEHPIQPEVNYKDIIEAEFQDNKLIFHKLHQTSDLKHFDYLLSKKVYNKELFEYLLKEIEDNDGYWTQIGGGLLLVSLPNKSNFDLDNKIQQLFLD